MRQCTRMTTLQEAAWWGAVPWSFTFAWKLQVAPDSSFAPQSSKFVVRGTLNWPTSCFVTKLIGVLPKLTTTHATVCCCFPPKTGPEANVEAAWAVPAIPHARTIPERMSLRIDVLLLSLTNPQMGWVQMDLGHGRQAAVSAGVKDT